MYERAKPKKHEQIVNACYFAVLAMIVQGKIYTHSDEAVNWGEVLEWLNKELAHAAKLKQY